MLYGLRLLKIYFNDPKVICEDLLMYIIFSFLKGIGRVFVAKILLVSSCHT